MRRAEALDAATFLIDQDRRVAVFDRLAQVLNESSDLQGVVDIPLEEDEAPRPFRAQKLTFVRGQAETGYTGDKCAYAHGAD
jgi:hypothetical protein